MERLSEFEKFMIALSGAKVNYIEKLSTEHIKYFGIGCTILFTAIFATISSSYALYRVFFIDNSGEVNPYAYQTAIGFGIAWGLMIFNLDRYVVSSMQKEDNFLREILLALPRIIVAALISIVVALPLEIKLFENRIVAEIERKKKNSVEDLTKATKNSLNAAAEKSDKVNNQIADNNKARLNPTSPTINNLENKCRVCQNEYQTLLTANNRTIESNKQKIEFYNSQPNPDVFDNEIQNLERANRKLVSDINDRKNECNGYEKSLSSAISTFINDLNIEKNDLINKKNNYEKDLSLAKTIYNSDSEHVNRVSKVSFSETLITQLEALNSLLNEEKDKGKYFLWYCNLFITLLFFSIETAPIFVKLISKSGSYDNLIKLKTEEEISKNKLETEVSINENIKANETRSKSKDTIYNNKKDVEEDFYNRTKTSNLEANEKFFNLVSEKRSEKIDLIVQEYSNIAGNYSKTLYKFLSEIADHITLDESLRKSLNSTYQETVIQSSKTPEQEIKTGTKESYINKLLSSKLTKVIFTLIILQLTLWYTEWYFKENYSATLAILLPAVMGAISIFTNSKDK
jgi:hypothetical protein